GKAMPGAAPATLSSAFAFAPALAPASVLDVVLHDLPARSLTVSRFKGKNTFHLQKKRVRMTRRLDGADVERYQRDGIVFPLDVLSPVEAQDALRQLEATEIAAGGRLAGRNNQRPHLLHPWMDRLVRHPAILDAVEDVLGPNLF